jgi:Tol biopolymer transport system component
VFSPDSRRVAYMAKRNESWVVVADDEPSKEYDAVSTVGPVFSPDSRHFAFGARRQSQWMMVLNGKECKPYTAVSKSPPVFSPNGEHFAYAASTGSGWVLVCDEKEYGLKGTIVKGGRIVFDANDGLHLITASSDNDFTLATLSF